RLRNGNSGAVQAGVVEPRVGSAERVVGFDGYVQQAVVVQPVDVQNQFVLTSVNFAQINPGRTVEADGCVLAEVPLQNGPQDALLAVLVSQVVGEVQFQEGFNNAVAGCEVNFLVDVVGVSEVFAFFDQGSACRQTKYSPVVDQVGEFILNSLCCSGAQHHGQTGDQMTFFHRTILFYIGCS